MCAKSYSRDSKEFQIMREFFTIMKEFNAIDTDERFAEYEEYANKFIEDEDVSWKAYKTKIINAWSKKLQKDRADKMEVMQNYYKNMQAFAEMESDADWEQAVASFSEFASKLNPNWVEFNSLISFAWIDKLEADAKKNQ